MLKTKLNRGAEGSNIESDNLTQDCNGQLSAHLHSKLQIHAVSFQTKNLPSSPAKCFIQNQTMQVEDVWHWPECFTALAVGLHVMLQGCSLTLAQTIDVYDGHHVVQLVVGSEGHGLPHGALWALSVTQQAVHTVTTQNRGRYTELCWSLDTYGSNQMDIVADKE